MRIQKSYRSNHREATGDKVSNKKRKEKKGTELAGPFSESVGYQSDSKKWTWFADQRRRMESMMGFAVSGGSILLKLESRKMYG